MSDENPTLKDIWRLLGTFNKRLDAQERHLVEVNTALSSQLASLAARMDERLAQLSAQMAAGFGSLKASIEARDFRLDEHGRRLSELESKL